MAEKKKQTQAERMAAQKNKATKPSSAKKTDKKLTDKSSEKSSLIPVRFYTACAFLLLFVLFLVIFLNPGGALTGFVYDFLLGMIGIAAFVICIPVFLYLFFIHAFSGKQPVTMRSICLGGFVLICGCMHHLIADPKLSKGMAMISDLYKYGSKKSGGVICGGIVELLNYLLNPWITGILLFIVGVLLLLAGMQITIPSIIRAVQNRPRAEWEDEEKEEKPEPAAVVVNHIANKRIEHLENKRNRIAQEQQALEQARNSAPVPMTHEEKVADMMMQIGGDVNDPVSAAGPVKSTVKPAVVAASEQTLDLPVDPIPVSQTAHEASTSVASALETEMNVPAAEQETAKPRQTVKPRKVTAKEADESAAEIANEIAQAETTPAAQYCYPPMDLLKLPAGGAADGTNEMRANAELLKEALASFKIDARIINVTRGPSVTRYEVELRKGVKLNKLTSCADDLALCLGARGVRIAAIPDKISVVGIEVPNKVVNMVSLREVIDSDTFANAKSKSSFAVGKDIGGTCIVGNIAKLPHMLIAGTTGSGKSVCMNSIIISLLYKASPEEVKLIMVDPKMVELGIYNGIPHLLIPVVTDPKKAAGSLQWAVTEMLRRYKAMSDVGVRDLDAYNTVMEMDDGQKLPQVVVIIDELADLMLVAAKEVEESICRIAQMGRASGIHLIIATQRPSADVITGLMKANIPSRIAFSVASAMESRIILDTQGAEDLVGRGDMLFSPIGCGKPTRVQGCFVSESEVEAVVTYVKNNFSSTYDQQVMDEIDKATRKEPIAESAPASEALFNDEMLPAAVDVILETGQASVSMLQRRLKLGYARAARIVDEMEELGVVGPFAGAKQRSILMSREQWQAILSGQGSGEEEQMNFDDIPADTASSNTMEE